MDLANLHWEQLPAVFATLALGTGATAGLLLLALRRPMAWAQADRDQSGYRRPRQAAAPQTSAPPFVARPALG